MQSGDSTKLKFEGLQMQKSNIPTDRWEKYGHLPSYPGYFECYDYQNVKNGYIFLFPADNNKKLVTFLEKYLSAPERFLSFLSENSMINSLCSCRSSNIEDRNIKKLLSQEWNKEILYLQRLPSC